MGTKHTKLKNTQENSKIKKLRKKEEEEEEERELYNKRLNKRDDLHKVFEKDAIEIGAGGGGRASK